MMRGFLVMALLLAVPAVMAQQTKRLSDYDEFTGLKEKAPQIDMLDAPTSVVELLKLFASRANLSVIVGPSVEGNTIMQLKDVTYGDALEIIMALNNIAYEVQGGIVKIMSDEVYKQRNGVSFYSKLEARTVQLKYASALDVQKLLEGLKSEIGTVLADAKTGMLVLKDTPAQIEKMVAIIAKQDISSVERIVPTVSKTFVLDYADPSDISKAIATAQLSTDGVGSVVEDLRMHQVIVKELVDRMPAIVTLIESLDKKPRQVFIEAKIIEVALTDEFKLGVDWDYILNGKDPRFNLEASSSFPGALLGPQGQLSYSTIAGDGALRMVVDALSSVGDTKILSNPHIAVTDGEEASVDVVTRQPYALQQFETGTTNITGVSYEFVDVGVKLKVQPKINSAGQVQMTIKPEVSSILSFYDATAGSAPGNTGVPVVKEATAETTITVKDGVTIIIAGMIQEQKTDSDRGIPLLQRLPLLGHLFKSKSESTQNTETIVFLTPRIITGDEAFQRMSEMKKPSKPLRGVASGKDAAGSGKTLRGLR